MGTFHDVTIGRLHGSKGSWLRKMSLFANLKIIIGFCKNEQDWSLDMTSNRMSGIELQTQIFYSSKKGNFGRQLLSEIKQGTTF